MLKDPVFLSRLAMALGALGVALSVLSIVLRCMGL